MTTSNLFFLASTLMSLLSLWILADSSKIRRKAIANFKESEKFMLKSKDHLDDASRHLEICKSLSKKAESLYGSK
jgi:hypothetical protein